MPFQSTSINPATTSPAADITKITNDLGLLRDVFNGTSDSDVPVAIPAGNIVNTPAGNIVSTNVQAALNELDGEKLALAGGTLTGALNEAAGAAIASASSVNLNTTTGNFVHITGTTNITGISLDAGARRTVVFDGELTLTNGASLVLPGAANIATAAGDSAVFVGDAAGVVRCVGYQKANGSGIANGYKLLGTLPTLSGSSVTLSSLDLTKYKFLAVEFSKLSFSVVANAIINGNNVSSSYGAANSLYGIMHVSLDTGTGVHNFITLSGALSSGSGLSYVLNTGLSSSSTSITFTASAGNFDDGQIRIWGI